MRLTSFVVWKSWASNPLRTVLTILGVGLGIAVVTSIHVLDHNTIQSRLREKNPDFGRVDLELVPKDAARTPKEVRQELETTDDIGSVGLLHGGVAELRSEGKEGGPPTLVEIIGLSPLPSVAFEHYSLAAGEDLSDLDGDEYVLISSQLKEDLDLDLGAMLQLSAPAKAPVYRCIAGQKVSVSSGAAPIPPASVRVRGILTRHALGRRNMGRVLISSFPLARRLAPHHLSFYQVNRKKGVNPDRLRRSLQERYQVHDQRSALLGEGSDERAFRNGVKVLGLLALVMGMLVVFQTLSQSLMERLKQIGLLRCLGTSRRAVAWIFLTEGLLLAVLGAVLGVAGGIAMAFVMGRMQWTTLGLDKKITGFELPMEPILFAGALGIFFTLAGSAFPLYKARNLPPIQVLQARGLGDSGYLLRGVNLFLFVLLVFVLPVAYLAMTPLLTEEGRETRMVLMQLGAIVLFFGAVLLLSPKLVQVLGKWILGWLRWWPGLRLPIFLVERAIWRSTGRFSAAVCGLAVVLAAMVALKHITYALRGEVRQFSARTMDGRLFFQGPHASPEQVKMVRAVNGVAMADLFEGMVQAPFLLSGMHRDSLARAGGVLASRPGLAERYETERCLVVSRRWAELRRKQAGQKYSVLTDEGNVDYEILAITDDVGFFPDEKVWAITAPHWLRTDFCVEESCVDRLAVALKPGADIGQIREAVNPVFPHDWFKTGAEIRDYLLRDVTKDFLLFDVLLTLILVLVGVGLVNTMTIAAVSRAREIGVLRALGMSSRALRLTFLLEGGIVAALATLMAVAMGIPLGYGVVLGLNRVTGLTAPYLVPWFYVALVPVLAVATGLLSAILPGLRAVRLSPAEAVRYE